MIQPKIETEDLILSINKNCQTLIEQSHTRPEETLEFKTIKPREIFHFNPPIQFNGDWIIGSTDLEVYISVFNITTANFKFEVHKFLDEKSGVVSYIEVRDEIERDLEISDITATNLQNDIIGQIIIKEYREQVTERMKDDKYVEIFGYLCYVYISRL